MIENRDEKEIVNDENENNESDYIKYDDFIKPNHNISFKPRDTILR